LTFELKTRNLLP